MSIEEQIASINAGLADLRSKIATVKSQIVTNQAATADWMRNYRGPGHSSEADNALRVYAAQRAEYDELLAGYNAQVDALTKQLDAANTALAAQNSALADAAAKGLTGDVALQRAKTRNMAIMAGVGLVVIVVALWAWKRYIRKK